MKTLMILVFWEIDGCRQVCWSALVYVSERNEKQVALEVARLVAAKERLKSSLFKFWNWASLSDKI